jgi:hypothetical protein
MILEHALDFRSRGLSARDLDAVCCTRGDLNHLLELGVFEGFQGLQCQTISKFAKGKKDCQPGLLQQATRSQLDEKFCRCRRRLVLSLSFP